MLFVLLFVRLLVKATHSMHIEDNSLFHLCIN